MASPENAGKEQPESIAGKGEKRMLPRQVLCKPTYFDVHYKINPWMQPDRWQSDSERLFNSATTGWQKLHNLLIELGFIVDLVEPVKGLPDMVFTANSAIVLDGKALLSHFRFKERQGEEEPFRKYFERLKDKGLLNEVASLPAALKQEGAGDCAWDPVRKLFWFGYGPRSDKEAAQFISDYFGTEVVSLELATREFYHLDVSLCPLSGGHLMYYPGAFSPKSLSSIQERVGDLGLEVDREDADLFALNAVNYQKKIIVDNCSAKLERQLNDRGYEVLKVPVAVFKLGAGSVWCLTLRLDHHR